MNGLQFAITLRDLFSSPLFKLARNFRSVTGQVGKGQNTMRSGFQRVVRSVGELITKIKRIPQGRINIDFSQVSRATQAVNNLGSRLGRFFGAFRGGGGGRFGGGRFGGGGGGGGGFGIGGMGLGGLLGMGRSAMMGLGVAGGVAAASAGAGIMAKNAVVNGATAQRDQFQMGVMLGNEGQASSLSKELRKYAKDTLFQTTETVDAGKQLVSAQERLERIVPIVKMLGDVSAGTGQSLKDILLPLTQVKAKGKLYAEELLQFQERQINLRPWLAKAKGIKEADLSDQIKDGKVGYEDVLKAFKLMTSEGGIYNGMASKVGSQTTFGQYQKMLGEFEDRLTEMGLRALPMVNSALSQIIDMMGDNGSITNALDSFVHGSRDALALIGELGAAIGLVKVRSGEAATAMDGINSLLGVFRLLGETITSFKDGIDAVLKDPWSGWMKTFYQGAKDAETRRKVEETYANFHKQEEAQKAYMKDVRAGFGQTEAVTGKYPWMKGKEKKKVLQDLFPGGGPEGGKGGKGKGGKGSVDATVSGNKSQTINITIGKFFEKLEVHTSEDYQDVEARMQEILARLLGGMTRPSSL